MDYINAMLVEIDDSQVVTIDGVKYFVMLQGSVANLKFRPRYEEAAKSRVVKTKKKPRVHIDQVRPAVLAMLRANPNSKLQDLRRKLKTEYKLEPADSSFRSMLQRMRKEGMIEVNGVKNGATWSLKVQPSVDPLHEQFNSVV